MVLIHKYRSFIYIICGSFLFALSVNLFLVPFHIYNGGVVGIAQLTKDLIEHFLNIKFTFNLTGVINFVLNIPLFIFAYRKMSRRFFFSTFISLVTQTIAFTVIPTLSKPLVDNVLVSIIAAGLVGAYGCSLIFKAKSSSGGMDIIGIYQSMKNNSSVGKTYMIVNAFIYFICALVYEFQIALYSVIYAAVFAFILDRLHVSNIEVSIMVFSKNKDLKKHLMSLVKRGITSWEGIGLYTGESTDVFITVVDKSEVAYVKRIIRQFDQKAFMIVSENLTVDGGFEKRLI